MDASARGPKRGIALPADTDHRRKRMVSEAAMAQRQRLQGDAAQVSRYYCKAEPLTAERLYTLNDEVTRVAELLIPFEAYYSTNPQGFFSMRGDPDVVTKMRLLVMAFGFLSSQACMTRQVKDEETKAVVHVPSRMRVTPLLEVVPSEDDPSRTVALRLRLVEQGPSDNYGLSGDVAALIEQGDMRRTVARQRAGTPASTREAPPAAYSLVHLDTPTWRDLCEFYRPVDMPTLVAQFPEPTLRTHNCAYGITKVFTVRYSLEAARRLGADPAFCDPSVYLPPFDNASNRREYGFADLQRVWVLNPNDLDPNLLDQRFMPWVRPDLRAHAAEIEQFERLHGPGTAHLYERVCKATSASAVANNMNALRERVARETSDLRERFGSGQEFKRARRRAQIEWVSNFSEIFHPDGDAPPAITSMATWFDGYLKENGGSARLPREKALCNLSTFEEFLAQFAAVEHTVLAVNSTHKDILIHLLSAFYVYYPTNSRPHNLLLGPPSAGKSFGLWLLHKLLVDGTVRMVTYLTQKSMATGGNDNDLMIMIFEDAPATMLGVENRTKTTGNTSNDMENMVKSILTSTQVSVQTLEIENGKRKAVYIKADCSILVLAAMNEPSSSFAHAMLDRFIVFNCVNQPPVEEGVGMHGKTQRAADAAVRASKNDLGIFTKRTQVLVAKVLQLQSAGVLCEVNMEGAEIVLALVTGHAKRKFNLDMDRQRCLERVRALIHVLVVLRAVMIVFDSPQSPVIGQAYSDHQLLHVEKHLFATQQIAIFVLGLLDIQWQDNLRQRVVSTMEKLYFPGAKALIEALEQPVQVDPNEDLAPPSADAAAPYPYRGGRGGGRGQPPPPPPVYDPFSTEAKRNWMYDTVVMGGPLLAAPKSTGSRAPSQEELLLHLAKQVMTHLQPRPLMAEVVAVLRRLTDQNIVTRRQEYELDPRLSVTRTSENPCLVLEHDKVRISLRLLVDSREADPVYSATRDVVHALFNASNTTRRAASYLVGQVDPKLPYVWRIINVQRDPNFDPRTSALKVWDPHYFESSLATLTVSFFQGIWGARESENRLARLFRSSSPWTEIDADIDSFVSLLHATDLGIDESEQMQAPASDVETFERQVYEEAASRRQLLRYPACFEELDKGKWTAGWQQRREREPELFTLSARIEALRRQQRQLQPLEPIVALEAEAPPEAAAAGAEPMDTFDEAHQADLEAEAAMY